MDDEIKEKILKKAISLEKYGINEFAWEKEGAIDFIQSIIENKIGILGGDVYKLTHHRLELLYDNWSNECTSNESLEAYYLRSKIEAMNYIKNYPVLLDELIIFSITFTEQM